MPESEIFIKPRWCLKLWHVTGADVIEVTCFDAECGKVWRIYPQQLQERYGCGAFLRHIVDKNFSCRQCGCTQCSWRIVRLHEDERYVPNIVSDLAD